MMFKQDRFDKYAEELEQDLEDGILTKEEYRMAMRQLIQEFAESYGED
jgi:hypothetical protein